MPYDDV